MKRLFIAGAGGFGREVQAWLAQLPGYGATWRFAGFLDDNPAVLNDYSSLKGLLVGPLTGFQPDRDSLLVCAIADVNIRRKLADQLAIAGRELHTVVHPDAIIGPRVRLGAGCVVCQRVTLTCDIEIGSGVILNIGSSVGHNAQIGDFCTLSGHCDVTGYARLGTGVFMGSHASILPGVQVGEGVRVGAGCIVAKNLPPHSVWGQMPPRQIG